MTINTSLCPVKDPALAWEVGVGRWQLAGNGEVVKAGPEMGREVVEPVDGVAQDTCSERRWMLADWVCR